MALLKYMGRDGKYPFFRLINNFIQDKNLYVTEIAHHVHSPSEYDCIQKKSFNIHIILKGQVGINDKILSVGDGYFHRDTNYTIKRVSDEDFEETVITFDGFTAQQFIKEKLGFYKNVEFFKLRENNDIMVLKDAVYADYTNINLDFYMLSKLYQLSSFILPPTSNIVSAYALEPSKDIATNKHLLNAFEYISSHYSEQISVPELAKQIHISQNYMCRLFKNAIGYTPQQYITRYKVKVSLHLITCTDYSIGQIAAMVGYNDAKHFSQIFKSIMHCSPTEYRDLTSGFEE